MLSAARLISIVMMILMSMIASRLAVSLFMFLSNLIILVVLVLVAFIKLQVKVRVGKKVGFNLAVFNLGVADKVFGFVFLAPEWVNRIAVFGAGGWFVVHYL